MSTPAARPALQGRERRRSGRRRCPAGMIARAAFRGEGARGRSAGQAARARDPGPGRAAPRARQRRPRAARWPPTRCAMPAATRRRCRRSSPRRTATSRSTTTCARRWRRSRRDLADPLPQLGAQRRRRLLDHRHRLPRRQHRAHRLRRQLRRRPARGGDAVRGRRAGGAAGRLRRRRRRRARVGDGERRPVRRRLGARAARRSTEDARAHAHRDPGARPDDAAGAALRRRPRRSPATPWPTPCPSSRRWP